MTEAAPAPPVGRLPLRALRWAGLAGVAGSLLLSALFLAWGLRTRWRTDEISYRRLGPQEAQRVFTVLSMNGGLYIILWNDGERGARSGDFVPGLRVRILGRGSGAPNLWRTFHFTPSSAGTGLILPHWFLSTVLAAPTVILVLRSARRNRPGARRRGFAVSAG